MSDAMHKGSVGIVIDRRGNAREMEWSEQTFCRIHRAYMAGTDDMCPNRDNVCRYCCIPCICLKTCAWGTSPDEPRDSLRYTVPPMFNSSPKKEDPRSQNELFSAFHEFYDALGVPPNERTMGNGEVVPLMFVLGSVIAYDGGATK